jgi:hypothetical protein
MCSTIAQYNKNFGLGGWLSPCSIHTLCTQPLKKWNENKAMLKFFIQNIKYKYMNVLV